MKTRPLFYLTSLLGCAPLVADDSDLLGMVGEKSDLVIHLANTSETRENWEKSSMKEFAEQDQIENMINEFMGDLLDFDEIEDEETAEALKESLTTLYESFDEEVLLTLATPTLSDELMQRFSTINSGDESPEEKGEFLFQQFGILLLAEIGDDHEKAEGSIDDLMDVFLDLANKASEENEEDDSETTVIEREIDGIEARILHVEDNEVNVPILTVGIVNEVLFVSMGTHEAEDVIKAIKEGHDTPLSDSAILVDGSSDLQMILDTTDLMAAGRALLTKFGEGAFSNGLEMDLDAGWKALGMGGFGQVSMNFDMSQPEVQITMKMETPTEGLMGAMMPSEELGKATTHAHKGVLATTQYSYDWLKMYDEVMKTAGAFSPDLLESIVTQLADMEEALGINLKEDILEHLDSGTVMVEYPDEDFIRQEMKIAFIMTVKDQAKLGASLKTLVAGMDQEVEEEEYLGKIINNVSIGPDEAISYCFIDGQIIAGIRSAGAVKEAIKQINNPRPTLWKEDFLEDYQDFLQSGLSYLGVMDIDTTMTSVMELVTSVSDDEDDWSDLKMPFGYGLYGMNQKDTVQTYHLILFPKK